MRTILKTARFTVRQYTEADFNDFVTLLTDAEVRKYLPQHDHEKWKAIFMENLIACEKNPELGRWGVEENTNGRLIGNCMLTPAREGLSGYEVGYAFKKQYWGTGAGTEIVSAIVAYAFAKPEIDKLCAITSFENISSQKVLLKAGFNPAGTFTLGNTELPLFELEK